MSRGIYGILAGTATAALAAASAAASPADFDIGPRPLGSALYQFGRQSNVQIYFDSRTVSDKRTRGVTGRIEPRDALDKLLLGTGLGVKQVGNGFAIVPGHLQLAAAQVAAPSAPPVSGDASATPAAAPTQDEPYEDIVVTAQRRGERLQRVPIVVSAFTGETLAKSGITDTLSVQQLVPGLTIGKNFAGATPFLRGIGNLSFGLGNDPSVATYVDGIYAPSAAAGLFALNNVERVEVLKGPQGTLFGRNALGGVIQVITKEPSQTSAVDAYASYANYDTYEVGFYGTTGLAEDLAANISVMHSDQGDGWGTNLQTGNDTYKTRMTSGQAKLMWTPGDRTKVTLTGFYNDLKTDVGSSLGILPGAFGTDGTPFFSRYDIKHIDALTRTKMGFGALRIDQDLGVAKLVSISAYQKLNLELQYAQNAIPGSLVAGRTVNLTDSTGKTETFTQELQLLSPDDSSISWILGGFYMDDKLRQNSGSYGLCIGNVCAATPVPLLTRPYQHSTSIATFGQATAKLSEATRLTLGLRYTRDRRKLTGDVIPFPGRPNTPATVPASTLPFPGAPYPGNPNGIDTDVTFPKMTWRVTIDHDLAEDVMAYASYNRGFKSGAFATINWTNEATKPEVIDAYEVGIKSQLLDRRLRLNVGAFYYDYTDMQLRTSAPPAPPGQTILYNAGKARIQGIDVDFAANPTRELTLNGGFELLDAKFTQFPGGQCIAPRPITATVLGGTVTTPCDRKGATLPRAPKFSAVMGFNYTLERPSGTYALDVKDTYVGHFFFDPSNRLRQRPYHLVNAALTWTAPSERWDVQLFARNLFDEFYYAQAFEGGGGSDNYSAGDPRTYGVKVGVHF